MAAIDEQAEAPSRPSSSQLPTLLIGAVFIVVAIVFAASSDWYDTFLAVHILAVVIWIGGGLFLTVMALLAERANDPAQLASLAKMAAFAGHRIFAPASLVVLAMGIAMVENAGIGFDHFWIAFGLIGFLITFVLGIGVLAPRSKTADELIAEKGLDAPETQAAISTLLLIARADVAMLLLVVVDMVTKPFS
jgi:uncharacterized membrane protein